MDAPVFALAAGALGGAGAVCVWVAIKPAWPGLLAAVAARWRSLHAKRAARRRGRSGERGIQTQASGHATPAVQSMAGASGGAWLRVADAHALLASVHANDTLAHLRRQSRLAPEVFDRDFMAAIERYAEFVQLMPASEAHHHAHAGGLLTHTLEMLLAAMTWRNGHLLPQGAQAEQVDTQRDQWTYVVFFTTLLHDVGKPLTDLRVHWRKPRAAADLRWVPLSGSLRDCGAAEYRVGFAPKAERDYLAHQRMGVTVLQRIAPPSALSFLATVPEAMTVLTRVLNGEDRDSSVAQLVRRADQASVGRALMHGSRARFSSTSTVPLVELLMGAVRELLRRGGAMPLNRDGAIGWVHDGSVWFVAKRLADTVREHLQQHAPDEGIPGEAKNDRLFDTWQEYGCLLPNPATGQAIWHVRVHGEDGAGYAHKLSVLRFALDKLWDDPSLYPQPMRGRVEVLAGRDDSPSAPTDRQSGDTQTQPLPSPSGSFAAAADAAPGDSTAPAAPPAAASATQPLAATKRPSAATPALVPAPRFATSAKKAPRARRSDESAADPAASRDPPRSGGDQEEVSGSVPDEDDDYLDDDDSAASESRKARARRAVVGSAASAVAAVASVPTTQALPPVALPSTLPKLAGDIGAQAQAKAAPEMAVAFMKWLQHGLATREIRYNETGAPVHFVAQGMALVSPLIFREFARQTGAGAESDPTRVGLDIQRDLIKAGWHLPAAGGVNIHQFSVLKRGGIRSGKLAAVVLVDPQRWVVPVPPANPALTTFVEAVVQPG